ncbi:hypothetical protein DNL40_01430 [Xylanimonas oleitrophica]|uniref:Uncharacterized protein n=1 Tax=Xylanimonas oleitrophica TaxID=2607479 RepID=A0A2W5YIY0_9MICO|nr:DUF6725 family protein [Xylanimonas oleitrophica]PZR55081.1 hypothetical protein DNL40_01430 [Xylanimonas oleitrophica]
MSDDTPAWRHLPAGARVVVRRRLSPDEAREARDAGRGAVWTDVIGVVLETDDAGLRLRTDAASSGRSDEVRVPGPAIEAVKRIPPRPPRRAPRHP